MLQLAKTRRSSQFICQTELLYLRLGLVQNFSKQISLGWTADLLWLRCSLIEVVLYVRFGFLLAIGQQFPIHSLDWVQ